MSSAPDYYEPGYDFTDFQETNPDTPLPADELDIQLEAIATAINTTQDRLAEIQNDDGSLRAGIVGSAQLGGDLTIGIRPAVTWTSGALYQENDTAYQGSNVYRCVVNHTSGVFATDLAAGKWVLVLDFEQYLDAAATSASQAEAAKNGAFFSAAAAAASSSGASTAETNFRNLYQVASSAPSTRFNGTALQNGDLYSNTTTGKLFIRRSGAWEEAVDSINATFAHTYANGNGSATSFNVTYVPGKLEVYVNGARQRVNPDSMTPGSNYDVGASNGTSVTFASAPASGTRNIQFVAFGTFSVADIGDDSIDTDQLVDGAVTAAKCEPGAYWYAVASNEDVYNITATFDPPMTALTNGTVVHLRPRVDNGWGEGKSITSLTGSGTTATATCADHGLADGDIVTIIGASQKEYNGFVIVDVVNASTFTYAFKGSAVSTATGTIYFDCPVLGGGSGQLTFNPNGLGAKPIGRRDGSLLAPGDVGFDREIVLIYNELIETWLLMSGQVDQFFAFTSDSTNGAAYHGYTRTLLPAKTNPFLISLKPLVTNTSTTPWFEISNAEGGDLGATVCRGGGRPLRLGDIAAGEWALLQWAGAYWELLNPKNQGVPEAVLQYVVASGTSGGITTTTGWQMRPLNTEVTDPEGIVTLSGDRFTLAAGTYHISYHAAVYAVQSGMGRIFNFTDNATAFFGRAIYTAYNGELSGEGTITIAAEKTFQLEQRSSQGYTHGMGQPVTLGENNIYTTVRIQKLA